MMPALTSSSLNFVIAVRSSWLGMTPASDSFVAFTRTMTFMANLQWMNVVGYYLFARSQSRDLEHRANFDGAFAGAGDACGDADRLVEIRGVDQEVTAEVFARFRESPSVTSDLPSRTRTLVAVDVG